MSGKADAISAVAVFLSGIVVSGVGFFLVEGREHITQADMDKSSPYMRDKGMIAAQFDEMNRRLERIEEQLDRLLDRKEPK